MKRTLVTAAGLLKLKVSTVARKKELDTAAEKWVKTEIAKTDRTVTRMSNSAQTISPTSTLGTISAEEEAIGYVEPLNLKYWFHRKSRTLLRQMS